LFIAFKFKVAYSSDCPPERKVTPGTEAGRFLDKVAIVRKATSSGQFFSVLSDPLVTMFGFKTIPSNNTFWFFNSSTTTCKTLLVIL
jgi:hypothetical protein